jgi:Trp operon repressor
MLFVSERGGSMSRVSRLVPCDADTLARLEELVARRTTQSGLVQRARIILACIAGETVQNIVTRLNTSAATVMRWKKNLLSQD